jgi:hypothetical protein
MAIYLAKGNPIIAVVLMSLSTFKNSTLVAAFARISLSFTTEEAAKQFVKDVKPLGCNGSFSESNYVVVIPDYAGSENAARAIYHAVNSYKDRLISVNEFDIYLPEGADDPLKDIEEYIKRHFGSDAVTMK